MVKVTPLVKHKQIKKRTATFFRMHSNRFMRVPVGRLCGGRCRGVCVWRKTRLPSSISTRLTVQPPSHVEPPLHSANPLPYSMQHGR